jgi:hypothetical protein
MKDKRIMVEINGDVHELTLTGKQAEGLKKGHEVGDWVRDLLWQQGGASFEAVKDDPRYREDHQNGPWMEMVIRVSAPAPFDCEECQGEGGEWIPGADPSHPYYGKEPRAVTILSGHRCVPGEEWAECAVCKGSGKDLD